MFVLTASYGMPGRFKIIWNSPSRLSARIAQSVQRLAKGPNGSWAEPRWELDFSHPSRQDAPNILHNRSPSFPGYSCRGVTLITHTHQAPRSKNKYRYTSTPLLCPQGKLQVKRYISFNQLSKCITLIRAAKLSRVSNLV